MHDTSFDYADCTLCALRCGADRTRGPAGACRAGDHPRVFCEVLECAEEPEFVPAWAISLSGCNFTCPFCITGADSQNAAAGMTVSAADLAARARRAVADGARSLVMLGGEPTIWLPFLLDWAARVRPVDVPLVLKTNLYCDPAALDAALDAFDVVVADVKFGNDDCARRLGGLPRYGAVLGRNLIAAAARRRLVVRHLLMPGHVDCCWRPVARRLRQELPGVAVHLRDHFVPTFRAARIPGLARTTTEAESAAALALAEVPA